MKILTLIFLLTSLTCHAKLLQIIHVNDMHSFFAGTRDGRGGYARLKSRALELKQAAAEQGIPTLFLNAGDSLEGSSYYFADRGVASMRAVDMLGIDVSVMGNHDFIQGPHELRRIIQESKLQGKLLSANLHAKGFMGLKGLIKNYVDFEFEGRKVRVMGLTTSEIVYQYPLLPTSFVSDPVVMARSLENQAVFQGIDYIIALTHLGHRKDRELISKTMNIDLVVGGHSHTLLDRPIEVANAQNRMVPMVQAGAHTHYLGSLIVDLDKRSIVSSRLHPIDGTIAEDESMKEFVDEARDKKIHYLGRDISEVIGESHIDLSGPSGDKNEKRTCWSRHIARLSRLKARTDIALQFDMLQGEKIPAGPITYGDIVDNFPHFRKWGDQGWKVGRARVSGLLLKRVLRLIARSEIAEEVTVDGAQVNLNGQKAFYDHLKHPVNKILINGYPIRNWKFYTIALPSEIPYALYRTLGLVGRLVLSDFRTVPGSDYWPMMEEYVRTNSPIECLTP